MQVKRFVAANMRLALKMVREEVGPDAVILSNKKVSEGVELLTAVDEDQNEAVAEPSVATQNVNPFEQAVAASDRPVHRQVEESKLGLEVDRMQREAKARAQALVAALAEKNREQLEQAVNVAEVPQAAVDEVDVAADVVDFNSVLAKASFDTGTESKEEVLAKQPEPESLPSAPDQENELTQMRFELQSMRDLLERQLSSLAWGQFSQQNPQQASLWKRLKRMGIGASIAEPLVAQQVLTGDDSPVDLWQSIMSDLVAKLPVQSNDLINDGGVFAFVGPTGAGKTTTIGKLATRYVLDHGADSVGLVTTDTMRIAAHEQLRTFGRILNVPVSIVDKNNSLERVLHSLRHKKLVLIDTAGLNRQDPRLKPQLNSLNEQGNRLQTVMVLPTTSQVEVIKAAYHTYFTDNLTSCVLTKLDETACLGEALTLAIDKSLSVAYTTDGQGIPDDIAVAQSVPLIRAAIDLAKYVNTDEESMAEELAAVIR